jgi:hypothetical protein
MMTSKKGVNPMGSTVEFVVTEARIKRRSRVPNLVCQAYDEAKF